MPVALPSEMMRAMEDVMPIQVALQSFAANHPDANVFMGLQLPGGLEPCWQCFGAEAVLPPVQACLKDMVNEEMRYQRSLAAAAAATGGGAASMLDALPRCGAKWAALRLFVDAGASAGILSSVQVKLMLDLARTLCSQPGSGGAAAAAARPRAPPPAATPGAAAGAAVAGGGGVNADALRAAHSCAPHAGARCGGGGAVPMEGSDESGHEGGEDTEADASNSGARDEAPPGVAAEAGRCAAAAASPLRRLRLSGGGGGAADAPGSLQLEAAAAAALSAMAATALEPAGSCAGEAPRVASASPSAAAAAAAALTAAAAAHAAVAGGQCRAEELVADAVAAGGARAFDQGAAAAAAPRCADRLLQCLEAAEHLDAAQGSPLPPGTANKRARSDDTAAAAPLSRGAATSATLLAAAAAAPPPAPGGAPAAKRQRLTQEQMAALVDSVKQHVKSCPERYTQLVIADMKERWPGLELNMGQIRKIKFRTLGNAVAGGGADAFGGAAGAGRKGYRDEDDA